MLDTQQSDDPFFDQFQPAQTSVSAPSSPIPNSGVSGMGTGGTAPGAPTGAITMQSFSDAWMASPYPGTVDGLKQFYAAHPEYAQAGITLGGSKGDKVYGPGGAYWGDGVIGAGAGGLGKSGLSGDTGGGAGGPLGAMGPWMQPYGKEYTLPTAADLQNMPGYESMMNEFNRANQNSAAAHGTLLNLRTNEAMDRSAANYGLQQYGTLAALGRDAFNTNYGIYKDNQDRPFDKAYRTAQLGRPSA